MFGYHLIRKFLGHYKERGSVLICELLVTKTAQDSFEIEHGYGSYECVFKVLKILQKILFLIFFTFDLVTL